MGRSDANVRLATLPTELLRSVLLAGLLVWPARDSAAQVATPDFDGDGFGDLAVAAPLEDLVLGPVDEARDAGAVNVIYGAGAGLSAAGNQFWHQARAAIRGTPADRDQFGRELAYGDFNGDGFDDLAVGVPFETVTTSTGLVSKAGAVNVIYGSATGLSGADNQIWSQGSPGVANEPETSDNFGSALVAGDFNGDGFDDLAIGIPQEDVAERTDAGAVQILHGFVTGLRTTDAQFWRRATSVCPTDPSPSTASVHRWRRGTSTVTESTIWRLECHSNPSGPSSGPAA